MSKPNTDWEAIEREYRAGQLSIAEIGRIHGLSHTSVIKRAKRDGWQRDLTPRVRQAVAARLVADGSAGFSTGSGFSAEEAAETIVDAAASRAVELVRQHRKTLSTGRMLVETLLGQLQEATLQHEEILGQIGAETEPTSDWKRRAMLLRATGLPARAATMRDLAAAARSLILLERQAFGLDDDRSRDQQPSSLGSLIDAVVKHRQQRGHAVIDITPAPQAEGKNINDIKRLPDSGG